MKKYIYITSSCPEFTFPMVYESKEEALKYTGIKRLLKVEVDIPEIEEEVKIAEEEEFSIED
jgi:hypothetical protein